MAPVATRARWPWAPALVAVCCCLAAIPLANGNPPATSDGLYHLLRSAELASQLQAGIAYPRWAPDFYLGYGYPIFLFTPLLPYYLVVAVHALGLPLLSAMNVVEAAALVASGLFAYAWLRRHVGPAAAMVGAVLYALAPYHLVNLYYRGDLSEFLAATWFPAILWSLDALLASPSARRLLLLALPVAALWLTHFISALLFLPVAGLLALTTTGWRRPRPALLRLLLGVAAAALAAGLSAISWLPAVALAGDATFAKLLRFYNYAQNFAGAGRLFSRSVVQQYTAVFAGNQGFGYQFGLLQTVALIAGIAAWLLRRRHRRDGAWPRYAAYIAVAAVSLAGCLALSAPLWKALPPLQLVQFPWRLLAIAALPASFFGALAIEALASRVRPALAGIAVAAVAVSCLGHLQPPRIALPADFATVAGIARFELLYHLAGTSAAAEYLPPWAIQRQMTSAHAFSLVTGSAPPADPAADVAVWTPSGRQEQFSVTRAQAGMVALPLLFFPGWQAAVDGHPAILRPAPESGLATVEVPAGRHTITLQFRDPPAARLGDVVSVLALLMVVGVGGFACGRGLVRKADHPSGFAGIGFTKLRTGLVALPVAAALAFAAVGGSARATTWQSLDVDLADGVHITGYSLAGGEQGPAAQLQIVAGQPVRLLLRATPGSSRRLDVELTDAATTDWADWQLNVAAGTTAVTLALPAALPPGLYALRLGSVTPGGTPDFGLRQEHLVRLLPVDGTLLIGPVIVAEPGSPPPALLSPLAVWPGQATLGDVRLPPTVRAGTAFTPVWTWQAPATPTAARLTETVHLDDASGHVLAAADSEPAGGLFPTPFWRPNQTVLDHPLLRLPADMPPGLYSVRVGLRNGTTTGPAENTAGRVLGDEATVGQVTILPPTQPAPWDGKGVAIGPLQVEIARPLAPAVPGRDLTISLRWHRGAADVGASGATVALERDGRVLATTPIIVGGVDDPAVGWRASETEMQLVDLPIPGDAAAGPASLVLSMHGDSPASTVSTALATVAVAGRTHVFTAQPATPDVVAFADGIRLLGYDLRADGTLSQPGTVSARTTLDVSLYWEAAGPTADPLKATVQLLSADGHLLAQADSEPDNGAAPTTGWVAGEIVRSDHHLALTGLPPGTGHLIVALYDPQTNQRIPAAGGDSVTLTAVTVP